MYNGIISVNIKIGPGDKAITGGGGGGGGLLDLVLVQECMAKSELLFYPGVLSQ